MIIFVLCITGTALRGGETPQNTPGRGWYWGEATQRFLYVRTNTREIVMFSNIKNRSYFSTVKKTFHYSLCFVEQQKEERYLHSGGGNKNLNFSHFIYLHINLLRMINHLFPFTIYPNNFVFILNFSFWETHFVHMNLIHNYDFIFWFFEINLSPPAIPIT